MTVSLNSHEARVLGVLIEKAFTTPDQYPLSLNALTNGANQKSNRDPVVDYGEAEVTVAMTGLRHKHLAGASIGAGSRVERWRHNAAEALGLGERALAVLAELLLRGAQAPGELRTRASRMRSLPNQEELAKVLAELEEKGYVRRTSGSRADRWVQTLSEEAAPASTATPSVGAPASVPGGAAPAGSSTAPAGSSAAPAGSSAAPAGSSTAPAGSSAAPGVPSLEERVERLEQQLARLAEQLGADLS